MSRIAIVTNTYFAQEFIAESLLRIRTIKTDIEQKCNVQVELIVVDDGSHDNTIPILVRAQKKQQNFHLLKLVRNVGSIYSLLAGFEYAQSLNVDAVIYLASDMQDPPELLPQMVEYWLAGSKFVICTRKSRQDPFITKCFSFLYYKLFTKIALKNFPKNGFDMMLLDKQVLDEFIACNEKNYTPQQLVFWLGYTPAIIEYDRQERVAGKSTWTFSKKVKLAIDTFVSMSYFPIRAMSFVGVIVAILSFFYGIFIIYGKLIGGVVIPGWTSIIVILSFLMGLIIMMLGVIGEYLWRVLDQVRDRPRYVIDYTLEAQDKDTPND